MNEKFYLFVKFIFKIIYFDFLNFRGFSKVSFLICIKGFYSGWWIGFDVVVNI